MRKFREWVSFREDGVVPGTPQMSPGGNTPMPLGHAHGNPNPTSGGAGAGGGPPQGEESAEDTALSGNMQRHLEQLITDLEKSQRVPRAKSLEILEKVVATLKGGGMKQQQMMKTVRNNA